MASMGFWRLAQENPAWIAAIDPDGPEHRAADLLARVNQPTAPELWRSTQGRAWPRSSATG